MKIWFTIFGMLMQMAMDLVMLLLLYQHVMALLPDIYQTTQTVTTQQQVLILLLQKPVTALTIIVMELLMRELIFLLQYLQPGSSHFVSLTKLHFLQLQDLNLTSGTKMVLHLPVLTILIIQPTNLLIIRWKVYLEHVHQVYRNRRQ